MHKYKHFALFFQKKRVIREFYSEFLFLSYLTNNPKLLKVYHKAFRKTTFSFIFFSLKKVFVKIRINFIYQFLCICIYYTKQIQETNYARNKFN